MIDPVLARRAAHLEALFDLAPMKRTFGMSLRFDDDLRAVFTQPYNPGFDHSLGGIHGGVVATLLDNAGWFTAAVHYPTWIATVEFHVRLLEHLKHEELHATGELVRAGKQLATATMAVRAGDRLVAVGSGTFAVTSVPIDMPR